MPLHDALIGEVRRIVAGGTGVVGNCRFQVTDVKRDLCDLGPPQRTGDRGNQDCRQDGNDAYHNQHLNQGETVFLEWMKSHDPTPPISACFAL